MYRVVLLLSTSSLNGYGIHRIFSFAKKAKYDGLDLFFTSTNHDLWDKEYIKELSDTFKVPVLSMTISLKWMNEKKVDQIIDIAKFVWVQVITFSPPHFSDKNITWFNKYLLKVKRDTHLSVAIQNVESKFIFFIIPEYKNATLSEIKRITWDTTLNLLGIDSSSGMDILKAQKHLGNSVKNVFFADKRWSKIWLLPWGAGWGISYLPLESFFMKLKAGGYNGFITLKVRPSELWVGNEERVLQNLEFAKNYYIKHYLSFK